MIRNRLVLQNAILSILQVIVTGGILFFLYRFILTELGAAKLGIWSLVLASSSVSRAANLGLSGSVVKYVAKYAAYDDHKTVSLVLQTTAISVGIFVGAFLLITYPIIQNILDFLVDAAFVEEAIALLPFAMVSVWLSTICNVLLGGLDGYQRIYLRSILLMTGMILYAILSVFFVNLYGLLGLAIALLPQYLLILSVGYILLRRFTPLPVLPYQWDKTLFREMIGYGVNFQLISVMTLLYDPVTKALLALFGDLAMVGYFEMANRMVMQVRSVVVAANQVLVPVFADLTEKAPEKIKALYLNSLEVIFFIGIPVFTMVAVFSPFISIAWVGEPQPLFISSTILLTGGWLINTLAAPAYFAYLGEGALKWNTISHVAIAILNLCFGWVIGTLMGGIGVVIGWAIALFLGSSIIIISYHIKAHISLMNLWSKSNRKIFISSLLVLILSFVIYRFTPSFVPIYYQFFLVCISIFLFGILPNWSHPIRFRLMIWVTENSAVQLTR